MSGIKLRRLFFLFSPLPVLKTTRFSGNFKANNGYFLANFRWKLAWWHIGRLLYWHDQKCISIQYLFRLNRSLPVYQYILEPYFRSHVKLWWPKSECASMYVSVNWRFTGQGKSTTANICGGFLKGKMWSGIKASCLWLILPSDFKIYPLKISYDGRLLQEFLICCTHTHDMHRLALLIRSVSKSRVLGQINFV